MGDFFALWKALKLARYNQSVYISNSHRLNKGISYIYNGYIEVNSNTPTRMRGWDYTEKVI